MLEQRLEVVLGPLLAFQELPMQVAGLLAQALQGEQVFLRRPERFEQVGRANLTGEGRPVFVG